MVVSVCTGGYYGCSYVEFAVGDPSMEVVGQRELKFFPGIGRGPHFPGFDYESNAEARAVSIAMEHTADSSLSVFYNGGGTFVPFEMAEGGYEVLARYENSEPCIVQCNCGEGKVVLSGVHFEASANMLKSCYLGDRYITRLLPEIEKFEKQRRTLFNNIIKLLLM